MLSFSDVPKGASFSLRVDGVFQANRFDRYEGALCMAESLLNEKNCFVEILAVVAHVKRDLPVKVRRFDGAGK